MKVPRAKRHARMDAWRLIRPCPNCGEKGADHFIPTSLLDLARGVSPYECKKKEDAA